MGALRLKSGGGIGDEEVAMIQSKPVMHSRFRRIGNAGEVSVGLSIKRNRGSVHDDFDLLSARRPHSKMHTTTSRFGSYRKPPLENRKHSDTSRK